MKKCIPPAQTLLEMAIYSNRKIDYSSILIDDPIAFKDGKLPITKDIADKLEENGYATAQFWINLQAIYEANVLENQRESLKLRENEIMTKPVRSLLYVKGNLLWDRDRERFAKKYFFTDDIPEDTKANTHSLMMFYIEKLEYLLKKSAENDCDYLLFDCPEDSNIYNAIVEELESCSYTVIPRPRENVRDTLSHPNRIEIRWDED